MLYRIMTEDKNLEGIKSLVGKYFEGFSLFTSKGFWKGIEENSLTIEVISESKIMDAIKELARAIKDLNSQDAVLVEVLKNNSFLI